MVLTMNFKGELAHRRAKALYKVTPKRNAAKQIARRHRRECILAYGHQPTNSLKVRRRAHQGPVTHAHHVAFASSERMEPMLPLARFQISHSRKHRINLAHFLLVNEGASIDPAKKVGVNHH